MRNQAWTETIWYRVPRSLARQNASLALAFMVLTTLAGPGIYAVTHAASLARTFGELALASAVRSPTLGAAVAGMDPVRRAQLPQRIESALIAIVPKLGLLAIGCGVIGAIALLAATRWLSRALESPDVAARVGASMEVTGLERALVAGAGALAHIPFARASLSFDEAAAALHATDGAWSWANTTLGYHNHVGGELSIRLATAVLGTSELSVRLPSLLFSCAGLVVLYVFVARRHGRTAALLAAALPVALPLWAEQTTLARGYGLLFFAGALSLSGLWDLLDGEEPAPAIRRLAIGAGLGLLAHPFFLFMTVATVALLAARRAENRAATAAAIVWIVVASAPAVLVYAPGVPATLYMTKTAARGSFRVIGGLFFEELGFRFGAPPARLAALATLVALYAKGVSALPARERRALLVIAAVSIGVPVLMRPSYLYPRFFTHLLALLFPIALPIARALDRVRSPRIAAAAIAVGVWALPRPWALEPVVDLRGAARVMRELAPTTPRLAAENFLTGIAFYTRDLPTVFVSIEHDPIPPDANVFAWSFTVDQAARIPSGFVEHTRLPGRESDVVIFTRR